MIKVGDRVKISTDEKLLQTAGLDALLENQGVFDKVYFVETGNMGDWFTLQDEENQFDSTVWELKFPPALLIKQ